MHHLPEVPSVPTRSFILTSFEFSRICRIYPLGHGLQYYVYCKLNNSFTVIKTITILAMGVNDSRSGFYKFGYVPVIAGVMGNEGTVFS